MPNYDIVCRVVHAATDEQPLVIPQEAVVVAGPRAIRRVWGRRCIRR